MKPLLATNLDSFMQRFDNFKDGEIRSMNIVSPTTITVVLTAQDGAKEFDWISVELEFNSVSDARVIENSKLHLIDMNNGVTIINNDGLFAFGIGECYNTQSVKNSTCYVICSDIKFQENLF